MLHRDTAGERLSTMEASNNPPQGEARRKVYRFGNDDREIAYPIRQQWHLQQLSRCEATDRVRQRGALHR